MKKGYIIDKLTEEKKEIILRGLRGAEGIQSAAIDVAGGMIVIESKKDVSKAVEFVVNELANAKLRTEMKKKDLREFENRIGENEYRKYGIWY